jgi:hypothetical protein
MIKYTTSVCPGAGARSRSRSRNFSIPAPAPAPAKSFGSDRLRLRNPACKCTINSTTRRYIVSPELPALYNTCDCPLWPCPRSPSIPVRSNKWSPSHSPVRWDMAPRQVLKCLCILMYCRIRYAGPFLAYTLSKLPLPSKPVISPVVYFRPPVH